MKAKHAPCSCGCGEMADECMNPRGNPLGAFTIEPGVGTFGRIEGHHPHWRLTPAGQYEPACFGCDCIRPGTGIAHHTTDAATAQAAMILAAWKEQGR